METNLEAYEILFGSLSIFVSKKVILNLIDG